MLTLLIDNHDSFTYNLFQLLAEVNGAEPLVVSNDAAGWEELAGLGFDNVVISPGPGRPDRAADFGVCAEAIRRCEAPLLGVCLGHQGIGWVHGARVEPAPQPLHGQRRRVEHDGAPLFAGIPSPFAAVRYHSLALARPLPSQLATIAWAEDGVPMALAHRIRPQWGVQFHPESIASEHGRRLLANFRDITASRRPADPPSRGSKSTKSVRKEPRDGDGLRLAWRRLDLATDPEAIFRELLGESESAFWLDSSGSGPAARFSFMGDASGPLGAVVSYDLDGRELEVRRGDEVERSDRPVLDYLRDELSRLGRPSGADALPFDFPCGFVGYLGYELKAECGHSDAHRSPHPDAAFVFADRLIALDHEERRTYLLALHGAGEEGEDVGADGLGAKGEEAGSDGQRRSPAEPGPDRPGGAASARNWIAATASRIEDLAATVPGQERWGDPEEPPRICDGGSPQRSPTGTLSPARSHAQYLQDVETCLDLLRQGESYEICLTDQLSLELDADPLDLYGRLRRVNPAPFAAYLRFGGLAVLSSSPERFLRVGRDGAAEARPIKGTSRRGAGEEEDAQLAAALAADEKSRAENLMIVDLLRNDLGAVCEIGSVEVPAMAEVETYETVHQLVSTVRGRLRPGASAVDCVRSCFPPGSMTGAPKERTVAILDRLEGRARGVYSGALGYFGLGGGCDLSVAIRTIVLSGGRAEIGAGGAVVLQSRPEAEHDEMLLKAAAPLRAVEALAAAGPTAAAAPVAGAAPISLALRGRAAAAPPRYVPELDEQEPWP